MFGATMEDYEQELYGIEDEFEDQFASELEVLAELEGRSLPSSRASQPQKNKLTFEEAITSGDAIPSLISIQDQQNDISPRKNHKDIGDSSSKKRILTADLKKKKEEKDSEFLFSEDLTLTPKPKRQRLDVVKKLTFGQEEEPIYPDSPPKDITPPLSPEDHQEMWNNRDLDKFLDQGPLDISDVGFLQMTPSPRRNKKLILKRPPVLEEYINVTSTDGTRVYMAVKDDPLGVGVKLSQCDAAWRGHGQLHLLGMPFSYLKEQVDDERRRKVLEASQKLTEVLNRHRRASEPEGETPEMGDGVSRARGMEEEEEKENQDSSQHSLWVDLFTPRHYRELLSDDYTNRCLLKWLKLWDVVVFGREKVAKKPKLNSEQPSARGPSKHGREPQKWKTKEQIMEEILDAELDQNNRPKYKVALLCGPPGLGKTTLAHVIARHAGYSVVEMNASDDRSPEVFKTRIEAATQMESVLGAKGKPNCLIIDEIDGAPTPSINVLLSIINRKDVGETETTGTAGGGKKRKKEGGLLLRPIICICNDQYTPSLRQLKQQAFLLQFPQTLPSRLVQRLNEISLRQGMKADTGTLMMLCEKTENDIRSCINTLQFLYGQGQKELSSRMVQTMSIGLKDQKKGLFSIWQEIFQLPKIQRQRIGQDVFLPHQTLLDGDSGPLGRGPLHSSSQRFHHILHITTSTGDHEKVAQGLYDNFLNMKLKDPTLNSICAAMDWLIFEDILDQTVRHGQNFQLMRYLPFLPVAFHLLFAANSIPRISYPNSQHEALNKMNQTQNLIMSLVSGVTPAARSRAGPQSLILEALCLLLDIISPKLRPVSTQLYSNKEKQQLANLINIMLAYNLTYHQERTPDGMYTYKLDPNIEEVCRFPDLPARKQLTYQTKQLIAREIDLEKMRRAEASIQARYGGPTDKENPSVMENPQVSSGEKGTPITSIRNHEQRLEHIMKRKTIFDEKPERDFFGREIVRKVVTPSQETQGPERDSLERRMGKAVGKSDVWFRFNEGVSNAVRRNLYIKDLL
ncbi:chromosome transmission fidelity protein 18 homolog isoform X2 [Antechinus flavipes]|uniref:chromosome transmission fidelity protein 18 homolog isoform X2 n=1 Tax=Antechinus flavipes TaxID=38775 RepID=UPI002236929C|nr:chromosome transmission fidelity protein 18 homolog isoform X2 [Antechinus flavipes]